MASFDLLAAHPELQTTIDKLGLTNDENAQRKITAIIAKLKAKQSKQFQKDLKKLAKDEKYCPCPYRLTASRCLENRNLAHPQGWCIKCKASIARKQANGELKNVPNQMANPMITTNKKKKKNIRNNTTNYTAPNPAQVNNIAQPNNSQLVEMIQQIANNQQRTLDSIANIPRSTSLVDIGSVSDTYAHSDTEEDEPDHYDNAEGVSNSRLAPMNESPTTGEAPPPTITITTLPEGDPATRHRQADP